MKSLMSAASAMLLNALPMTLLTDEAHFFKRGVVIPSTHGSKKAKRRRNGKHAGRSGGVGKMKTGKDYSRMKPTNTYNFELGEAQMRFAAVCANRVRRYLRNRVDLSGADPLNTKLVPGHIRQKMELVMKTGNAINAAKKEMANG